MTREPPRPSSRHRPLRPADDPMAEIQKLAQLHSAGALTDEEFAAAKAKILGI